MLSSDGKSPVTLAVLDNFIAASELGLWRGVAGEFDKRALAEYTRKVLARSMQKVMKFLVSLVCLSFDGGDLTFESFDSDRVAGSTRRRNLHVQTFECLGPTQ